MPSNTTKIIGFSLIGLIALYFFKLKRTIEGLNYYVAGVDLKFDNNTPVLRIDLGIQNPDENSFTIKSIVGNLYANGYPIGNVSSYNQALVPPAGNVIYSLYIRLSLINIVSDIVSIFTGGGIRQRIEFSGTVRIDNITAPLDFEYILG